MVIPTTDHFSRERLAGYEPEILFGSRVALIGAGALGQNAALAMALSGVGTLAIVDYDDFEPSNRTRSPFFVADAPKADAVARGFLALATAPRSRAYFYQGKVQEVGDLLITWADVVVSAVDSQVGRGYLAERCRLLHTPFVEAGFDGLNLSISVFRNHDENEPCWRCPMGTLVDGTERGLCTLYAKKAEAAGVVPAVQAVAQVSGAMVADAAIAALHDEFPLAGKRWTLNLRTGRSVLAKLTSNPDCAGIHHPLETEPHEIRTGGEGAAADIFAELAALHDDPVELHLPAPFVESLPCARCGRSVSVGRPLWAVHEAPRCSAPCHKDENVESVAAGILPDLTVERAENLRVRSLAELGLGPGAIIQASWDNDDRWIRLAGNLEDVFNPVERGMSLFPADSPA